VSCLTLAAPLEYTVLVVIDIQERLAAAMGDFAERGPAMVRAIRAAALLGIDVVVTEQYPRGLGPTVADVAEALPPGTPRFEKTAFSCWGCIDFAAAVQASAPETLVLVGMETHVCVQQTALQAIDRGHSVVLLADAVCSRHAIDRETALALMRARGVTIATVEALAFDWLTDSRHPAFKQVSALFK